MAKYRVAAKAGIDSPNYQDLDWTDEDYKNYSDHGLERLEDEVRGVAIELTDLDFWVEKIED